MFFEPTVRRRQKKRKKPARRKWSPLQALSHVMTRPTVMRVSEKTHVHCHWKTHVQWLLLPASARTDAAPDRVELTHAPTHVLLLKMWLVVLVLVVLMVLMQVPVLVGQHCRGRDRREQRALSWRWLAGCSVSAAALRSAQRLVCCSVVCSER